LGGNGVSVGGGMCVKERGKEGRGGRRIYRRRGKKREKERKRERKRERE